MIGIIEKDNTYKFTEYCDTTIDGEGLADAAVGHHCHFHHQICNCYHHRTFVQFPT